jgi:hypothetical protein
VTCLLADSLGGTAYSYPLGTRSARVGRFPWKYPSDGVVLCSACGDRPVRRRSTLCAECAPVRAEASDARRRARARAHHGKRCGGCGRVKGRGRGHRYCAVCRARRAGEAVRICERCPSPVRSKHAKLCEGCHREARAAQAEYKRRWIRDNRPPTGSKSAESMRMTGRLAREKQGAVLDPVPPLRESNGARVDADGFSCLPVAPLVAAVESLIHRTALDSPFPVELAAEVTGEDGKRRDASEYHRDGAPSAREAVCDRLGIAPKSLYTWAHGQATVRFDVADRVVTRAGWLWWDVFRPCRSGCAGVFGPSCEACHGHELARRAFEGS